MNWKSIFCVPALLLLLLFSLTACGGPAPASGSPEAGGSPETEGAADEADGAAPEETSLSSLLGEDYQEYIIETVTMQMGNRMDKDPDVVYLPIREHRPLTDYVAIDETTSFAENENGHVDIIFPAGTVTDEAHGEQTFTVPRP